MEVAEEKVSAFLSQPHRTVIYPDALEDGSIVYMALDPDLPGCMSHGPTPEEAKTNLEDARDSYVRALLSMDLPLPECPYPSLGTFMPCRTTSFSLSACEPKEKDAPEPDLYFDYRMYHKAGLVTHA